MVVNGFSAFLRKEFNSSSRVSLFSMLLVYLLLEKEENTFPTFNWQQMKYNIGDVIQIIESITIIL
jgi:uncharacterized membrane protein